MKKKFILVILTLQALLLACGPLPATMAGDGDVAAYLTRSATEGESQEQALPPGEVHDNEQASNEYGLHVAEELYFGTLLNDEPPEPVTSDDYRAYIDQFFDWARAKGYTSVHVWVIGGGGEYVFQDPTLAELRWLYLDDLLAMVMDAARAEEPRLKIYADITIIAWQRGGNPDFACGQDPTTYCQPPTLEQHESILDTLLNPSKYDLDGIVAESFEEQDFLCANYAKAEQYGKEYVQKFDEPQGCEHILMSEDYGLYPNSPEEVYPDIPNNRIETFNMMAAHARAQGKPVHTKVSAYWSYPNAAAEGCWLELGTNIFYFRAFQDQSNGFFLMTPYEDCYDKARDFIRNSFSPAEVEARIQQFQAALGPRPVANVHVLGAESVETEGGVSVMALAAWVVSALSASGYEVKLTNAPSQSLVPDAALTYVITKGGYETIVHEVPQDVLDLMADPDTTVFWSNVAGIPNVASFQAALSSFGLSADHYSLPLEGMPETIVYDGTTIPWQGTDYVGNGHLSTPIQAAGAETLVSATIVGETWPVATRQTKTGGANYFVSGNMLRPEAAYLISRLTRDTLQTPANAYLAVGEGSFAALSNDDGPSGNGTPVSVRLPGNPGRVAVYHRDREGQALQDEVADYTGPFTVNLKKGSLIIVVDAGRQESKVLLPVVSKGDQGG